MLSEFDTVWEVLQRRGEPKYLNVMDLGDCLLHVNYGDFL